MNPETTPPNLQEAEVLMAKAEALCNDKRDLLREAKRTLYGRPVKVPNHWPWNNPKRNLAGRDATIKSVRIGYNGELLVWLRVERLDGRGDLGDDRLRSGIRLLDVLELS